MNQISGNNIINNNNSNGQIFVPTQTPTNTIATGSVTGENPRTLYVGNLDSSINETFIHTLFSPFGNISGLKLITDNQNDLYCFIEYEDPSSAATAITTMNKRLCLDREMKVNWASNSSGASGQKTDTSKHFHIFVGDLSPEIETQQLREAFAVFGEISDCRVVRDLHTTKSKGYGFVSFVKRQDAENAIAGMNGQWLGHRPIRTNWATRKMSSLKGNSGGGIGGSCVGVNSNDNNMVIGPNVNNRTAKYEEVFNSSSITNCTVYCGGIMNGLTEELMQKTFSRFGTIQEIRVFKEKGYAFIKFTCKEAATNAIVMMNNQEILGQTVKCSWGKETNDAVTMMGMPTTTSNLNAVAAAVAAQANLAAAAATTPLIYPYGHHTHHQQQLSYWYQPTAFQAAIHAGHPQAGSQHPASIAAGSNPHHHHHHPHHQTQYTTVQTTATGLQYPYNQHQYYSMAAAAAAVAAGQTPNPAAAAGFNSSPMAIPISASWTAQSPLAGTFTNNSTSVQLSGAAASGYPPIQGYQAQ
ncbi:nucleolysin TIAR-like protein [Euroglyphus maynei]|uniref:Nucleolysin TIAR-like protein n=1 Tax=Euroglyphus maynei TaxID=6958 RepID=A0A1Y3BPF7_EURMA|nr:nucleolysin TIAR-like protein [Euroglyphus maynei]